MHRDTHTHTHTHTYIYIYILIATQSYRINENNQMKPTSQTYTFIVQSLQRNVQLVTIFTIAERELCVYFSPSTNHCCRRRRPPPPPHHLPFCSSMNSLYTWQRLDSLLDLSTSLCYRNFFFLWKNLITTSSSPLFLQAARTLAALRVCDKQTHCASTHMVQGLDCRSEHGQLIHTGSILMRVCTCLDVIQK